MKGKGVLLGGGLLCLTACTWLAASLWLRGMRAPVELAGTVATLPAFFLPLSLAWKMYRLRVGSSPGARLRPAVALVFLWQIVVLTLLLLTVDGLGRGMQEEVLGLGKRLATMQQQGELRRYLRETEEWPREN